ncbi:MAG TPA: hypothetical protein VE999_07415, partial [Gemmataceae bacterium]|nr:hypothetical protein [Gemmataceae bacterium]
AIARVVAELLPVLGESCPAAVVAWASWPEQKILRGTLGDIAAKVAAAGIERNALILVGAALAASDEDITESALYSPHYHRRFRNQQAE